MMQQYHEMKTSKETIQTYYQVVPLHYEKDEPPNNATKQQTKRMTTIYNSCVEVIVI